ncbi:hypothetical protein B0J11DRAFT_251260 [Dendryphion nanum]|uniref:BZIP domain-containing protein n=1 Tax=Dendryphion nanum TaxID=256645 RepID=A0A9P9E498_9PLEO|nr:hypothetical protein B0J11DRAFT_251260 [Dendryphion nanum]
MSEPTSSKAQNLARIRDNQRRSRARRKEYLQELEAKLRQCEQMGVEASAEIQGAARKVLEENRRLRAMLRTRGVPEVEISAALGFEDRTLEPPSSAAPALMSALERKWTYNGPSAADTLPTSEPGSTTIAPQIPAGALTPISIPQQPALTTSMTETNSPHSVVSSTGTPPSYVGAPFFTLDTAQVPPIKTELYQTFNNYSYDPNSSTPWLFPSEPTYGPDVGYYNTTSCVDAATLIRTVQSDVGTELEVDLGCGSPDQDCRVPNPMVFTMMDKYSSHPSIRM